MEKSCLIIDEMHQSIIPMLEEKGFYVHYAPDITREKLMEAIVNYTGIIVRSKTRIDKEVLAKAFGLKFVGRAGAGVDKLDLEALEERNIEVINAPEGNRDAVAEHTMGLLLGILNNMHTANEEVKQFNWNRPVNRGVELKDKTVGILGFGYMGSAVAQRLQCFGVHVIAFDKYKTGYAPDGVREVDEETLFKETDILSIHVPLTPETRGMVNQNYLDQFAKNIFILNTARGEIIHLKDLVASLRSGKVSGAGLDVLEWENMGKLSPEQRTILEELFSFRRVLVTPHVAGWTWESYEKINRVLVEKIQKLEL